MASANPLPAPVPEAPAPPSAIKTGWKTSEFWVTIGTLGGLIGATMTGHDPNAVTSTAAGVVAGIYALVRMFAKKQ